MNTFADRLVARAAGQPLGSRFSLPVPRTMARFEPPLAETVTETDTYSPAAHAARVPTAPMGHAPDHPKTFENETAAKTKTIEATHNVRLEGAVQAPRRETIAEAPTHEALETSMPAERPETPIPLSHPFQNEDLIERFTPTHPPQPADSTPLATSVRTVGAPAEILSSPEHDTTEIRYAGIEERVIRAPQPSAFERTHERRAPRNDYGLDATPARPTTANDAARQAEPQPAPTISIGKIEVQFLPQTPRPSSPPPAQRTRGFDSYARARRGEPR